MEAGVPNHGAMTHPQRVRTRRSAAIPATTTSNHAANPIQKNTNDAVWNGRQPVSTVIANVAAEYIPSGNTVANHEPLNRRSRCRSVVYTSTGIHNVAATHVTTVTERTAVSTQSWVTMVSPARCS